MDEQPATQPEPALPPDRSPAAKDAAIAKLKAAEPNIHFDTAYNILRADPAFDANDPDERIYIMGRWPGLSEAEKTQTGEAEKPTEAPAQVPPPA
jgi:hypothetical protein